jgi:ubiquinone biosynthesis protein COQ4
MRAYRSLDIHRDIPETAPLPPRKVEWRKAFRLVQEVKERPYDPSTSYELVLAMDGGDTELVFQNFLAEPGARDLIKERPELVEVLADRKALAAMDEGSLGRAYLALMEEDGYTANGLTLVQDEIPAFHEVAPDAIRRWFSLRCGALHDVAHALTGYGRCRAGEAALNMFTSAASPMRFVRVYSLIGALAAPTDRWLRNLSYMRQAWNRGARSRIPLSAPWEKLLPLSIEEIQRKMQIPRVEEVHPEGILREAFLGGPWIAKA